MKYCRSQKMQLLFFEDEEEHEYLYNFMSFSELFTYNTNYVYTLA